MLFWISIEWFKVLWLCDAGTKLKPNSRVFGTHCGTAATSNHHIHTSCKISKHHKWSCAQHHLHTRQENHLVLLHRTCLSFLVCFIIVPEEIVTAVACLNKLISTHESQLFYRTVAHVCIVCDGDVHLFKKCNCTL